MPPCWLILKSLILNCLTSGVQLKMNTILSTFSQWIYFLSKMKKKSTYFVIWLKRFTSKKNLYNCICLLLKLYINNISRVFVSIFQHLNLIFILPIYKLYLGLKAFTFFWIQFANFMLYFYVLSSFRILI